MATSRTRSRIAARTTGSAGRTSPSSSGRHRRRRTTSRGGGRRRRPCRANPSASGSPGGSARDLREAKAQAPQGAADPRGAPATQERDERGIHPRMEQNEEIFVRYMNDAPFQQIVSAWMASEAYRRLRAGLDMGEAAEQERSVPT